MNVIKRNGKKVEFDKNKIFSAIDKANQDVLARGLSGMSEEEIVNATEDIAVRCDDNLDVESIQNIVEEILMAYNPNVARQYIRFRYSKEVARKVGDNYKSVLDLVELQNEELKEENSNKNAVVASTQRDYIAGETSKTLTKNYLLPEVVVKAHEEGLIHFHDMDYFVQHIINCNVFNLDDMLQNGTVINKTLIEKPHTITTACNIATQIIALVASGQYGGQTISLTHLAPFVDESRKRIRKELQDEIGDSVSKERFEEIVEKRVKREIERGVQILQYQINTLNTSNGQTPFISVFMYINEARNEQEKHDLVMLIEEVLRQRIQGVKNEKGVYIAPTFPKLLYVLQEDNVNPDGEYYWLTKLAAECTAKRMVPDYISEKIMKENKINGNGDGDCYGCMGCRSFLTPDQTGNGFNNIARAKNYDGKPKYYGRFNQGVVTLNLVDAACSAKDLDDFWNILNERLEICHLALQCRHKRLEGTVSDISPIHWQFGALARLEKGEKIDPLLHGNYSTLSLGYAGLWECVYKLIGKKLTEPEGEELGLQIMQRLNDACNTWRAAEDIGYSVYGTPLENSTYRFAKCLKKRFGVIEGVTDKNYITNSYHIKVTEPIDAFNKLRIESKFQKLSPGGAISYVEVPNMAKNIDAVLEVIKYIYDHIMYAELNTKLDYCQKCGFSGEIQIIEDEESGKLVWECPQCGNRDQDTMNVIRRTCGYLGSNYWSQGRTQEIKERVLHL